MEIFLFIFAVVTADIGCKHPKVTQLEKAILDHKKMKIEYNNASREFVKENNHIRHKISKYIYFLVYN